ncbi:unnamed protein product [Heligmosomoides polygyrus]|uniref:Uncharacterized protein n=1 Tax=Heligmosomoides polygyrus TaxID=6339 RepID=A0A183G1G4_HELPZ|nr:unnamed protein product [Heligmosomoides polygyrus]
MKEKDAAVVACIRLPTVTTVEEKQKCATDSSCRFRTGPRRRKIEKLIWLWTDDVKEKARRRKEYTTLSLATSHPTIGVYIKKRRGRLRTLVAVAKASHYEEVNEKLETRDGERQLYRLAKARRRQSEDIQKLQKDYGTMA